jgi:hypothetical protein
MSPGTKEQRQKMRLTAKLGWARAFDGKMATFLVLVAAHVQKSIDLGHTYGECDVPAGADACNNVTAMGAEMSWFWGSTLGAVVKETSHQEGQVKGHKVRGELKTFKKLIAEWLGPETWEFE